MMNDGERVIQWARTLGVSVGVTETEAEELLRQERSFPFDARWERSLTVEAFGGVEWRPTANGLMGFYPTGSEAIAVYSRGRCMAGDADGAERCVSYELDRARMLFRPGLEGALFMAAVDTERAPTLGLPGIRSPEASDPAEARPWVVTQSGHVYPAGLIWLAAMLAGAVGVWYMPSSPSQFDPVTLMAPGGVVAAVWPCRPRCASALAMNPILQKEFTGWYQSRADRITILETGIIADGVVIVPPTVTATE